MRAALPAFRRPNHRRCLAAAAAAGAVGLLGGCASVGLGVSLPIPGIGSVGVGVDNHGNLGGGVTIGTHGVGVTLGGTARLPEREVPASAPSGAQAPARR